MPRLEDDNMNEKISRLLKDLPKINTPSNFDNELSKRINQSEQRKEKVSWFDKIFSPKLIPSAALAVTTVIILFLLKGNVNEAEDPFQIMPKLREEKILKQDQPGTVLDRTIAKKTNIPVKKEKSDDRAAIESESKDEFYRRDSNISEVAIGEVSSIERISITTSNYIPDQTMIMEGGLNYKMIRSNEDERKEIEVLRKKLNQAAKYQ